MIASYDSVPLEVAQQIDRQCVQFDLVRRTDGGAMLNEFLNARDAQPESLPRFLEELVLHELDALMRDGIVPRRGQLVTRFPAHEELIGRIIGEHTEVKQVDDLVTVHGPV